MKIRARTAGFIRFQRTSRPIPIAKGAVVDLPDGQPVGKWMAPVEGAAPPPGPALGHRPATFAELNRVEAAEAARLLAARTADPAAGAKAKADAKAKASAAKGTGTGKGKGTATAKGAQPSPNSVKALAAPPAPPAAPPPAPPAPRPTGDQTVI